MKTGIFFKYILFLFTLLTLCGCGDLLKKPEPLRIITMQQYTPEAPLCEDRLPLQLTVGTPAGYAGLNTDRIAIMLDDREIRYLAGYKWDEPSPVLVMRMLTNALNTSGCFTGAGSAGDGLNTPYRLAVEIRRMHLLQKPQRKEHVETALALALIDAERGTLIARQEVSASREGDFSDIYNLGAAMENDLRQTAEDAAIWAHAVLRDYHGKTRAMQ